MMGNLNAKVDYDNTLLTHMMGKHSLGDGNNNGKRLSSGMRSCPLNVLN